MDVIWVKAQSWQQSFITPPNASQGVQAEVPVLDGRLAIGTWQQLVLVDFDDRPRERTVVVQLVTS